MPETNNVIFLGKSFWNSRELTSTVMFMMTMSCVVADDFVFRISALQENLSSLFLFEAQPRASSTFLVCREDWRCLFGFSKFHCTILSPDLAIKHCFGSPVPAKFLCLWHFCYIAHMDPVLDKWPSVMKTTVFCLLN